MDKTFVVSERVASGALEPLAVVRAPNAATAVGRVRSHLVPRYGGEAASIPLEAELVEPGQTRWLE